MYNNSLYNQKYHVVDLSKVTVLVTGGAGFIGSNLVEYLLRNDVKHVRVVDNLSNGYWENISDFVSLKNFEFIEGDITDSVFCQEIIQDVDYVSHQAALGSVPRSINDPLTTNLVNITGFLNILDAVRQSGTVKRMVYAASSSTYGDSSILPKVEGVEGKPLSPYAVTKLVNELYADVFSKVYGLHTIGLRYFNVFGPKQNPNNPYAAVIPKFCKSFLESTSPTIFGDGLTSRDFTFVENVVQANVKALFQSEIKQHQVYNVACGEQTSLRQIVEYLCKITNQVIEAQFEEERVGDIKHSKASVEKISTQLGYKPTIQFFEGLMIVYQWYQETYKKNQINAEG